MLADTTSFDSFFSVFVFSFDFVRSFERTVKRSERIYLILKKHFFFVSEHFK